MNLEFSFFRAFRSVRSRAVLSATIILSFAFMMILPIFLIGVINNSLLYFKSYIPENPEKVFSVYLDKSTEKVLDIEAIKKQMPQIDGLTLHPAFVTFARINQNFEKVEVIGYSRDIVDIINFNIVQGEGFQGNFFDREDVCVIGSGLVQKYGKITSVDFKGKEWQVRGIVHDKEHSNKIIVPEKSYVKLNERLDSYVLQWKHNDPIQMKKDVEQLEQLLSKEVKVDTFFHWKEYFENTENNNKLFLSLLLAGTIIISVILLYGCLNIMTILVSRIETEHSKHKISLYLGASRKDFWWYEFFSLGIMMGIAILIDVVALSVFKESIQTKLGLYMTLDFGTALIIVLGALGIIGIISFALLRKSLKQNRIYRE